MGFSTSTCTEFVEVLSSKAPVPGGGGASALVGAVGTALGNMVGSLTVGKKKYADVEDEMWELKKKCDQLQKDFLHLIGWRSWRNAVRPLNLSLSSVQKVPSLRSVMLA